MEGKVLVVYLEKPESAPKSLEFNIFYFKEKKPKRPHFNDRSFARFLEIVDFGLK